MRTARGSSCPRGGSKGLPQCMMGCTPWVWAWRPPLVVGLETPPGCGPGDFPWVWAWRPPSGCGPGDPLCPPDQTPQLPPWVWAWRPPTTTPLLQGILGYHLQCMLGYHLPAARHAGIPPAMHAGIPPCEQTDSCKNITFALRAVIK